MIRRFSTAAAAVLAPAAVTALLVGINAGNTRDYIFVYLAIVAVLGLASGLRDALIAAVGSFLLLDFFFVRPVHSLQFADSTDLLNLIVFAGTAAIVGTLGSRRRVAQMRAEQLARDLQDANLELARLAETERQVRDLEETDRLRREVLANVSHELRTPLAGILTGATLLEQRRSLPEDARADAGSIASQARRLNRLVSDLLDMTRIGGGIVAIQPTEVDLAEAAEAAAERLRVRSPGRPVTVAVAPGTPEVSADWHRLGQVLDNLLENADRAAPPGTAIRISAAKEGDQVVTRVVDSGPGVPASLRGRLFERFVRGEDGAEAGEQGGMGLGLAIVRGLVQAQRGDVWLDDTTATPGASFAFSLPVAAVWG